MRKITTLCFLLALVCVKGWGQASGTPITSSTTFTVPAGVSSLKIECWGGGGGGGGSNGGPASTGGCAGGGGGGGAYSAKTIIVSGGQSYTITIGAGGIAGTAGNNSGQTGGNTSVTGPIPSSTIVITALGGGGGGGAALNTAGIAGAAAAVGSGYDAVFAGGAGTAGKRDGNNEAGGGGGGGAGNTSAGGAASISGTSTVGGVGGTGSPNTTPYKGGAGAGMTSTTANAPGINGTAPGGGGTGGASYRVDQPGGAGGAGQVVLTYTLPAAPTLTASPNPSSVDNNFTITATAAYVSTITSIQLAGVTLTSGTDYSINTSTGVITFTPSATGNASLRTPGTYTFTVNSSSYNAGTFSETLTVGAAAKLAISTQPTAPATNGAVLATQPVVKITDKYGNTTTSTVVVTATVGAGAWTLGGTTAIAGVGGTVTYTNLTATSAAAVTGATITFTATGLTSVTSGTFNIPAPPPANDNCSGAINLTVNAAAITGTFSNSTPMTGASKNDVFYMFTPAVTASYTITINTFSVSGDKDLYVYSICPATYSTTTNVVASGASGSTSTETASGTFTAGTSYKILVQDYDGVGGTFNINVTGPTVPGAPTIGTATAGDASATVAFTAPSSNGGAAITSYTAVSNPGNITATGTTSPINVTGLTNGTAYTFTVYATNGVGNGPASGASNSVTPLATCTTPNAPASVTTGQTTLTSIPMSIAAPSSGTPTGYLIITSTNPTLSSGPVNNSNYTAGASLGGGTVKGTVAYGGATTSFTASSLSNNTKYYVFVYSYNSGCTGAPYYSTTSASDDATTIPAAPTAVSATAGNAQANVSFTAPGGSAVITGYTVTSSPGGITATGTTSPVTVTGLTNNTAYTFTVTATNAGGTSAPSSASNSVTPLAPCTTPNTPGALSYTSSTMTSITGSFVVSSGSPTGYIVVGSTNANLGAIPAAGTTYTVGQTIGNGKVQAVGTGTTFTASTGATSNTGYYFFVYAYNNTACSGGPVYSPASTNSLPYYTCIDKPTGLTTSSTGNSSASLSWTAPNGTITSYTIKYGTTSGTYTGSTNSNTTSVTLTGLLASTTYYYVVVANNTANTSSCGTVSANSTESSFTTLVANDLCTDAIAIPATSLPVLTSTVNTTNATSSGDPSTCVSSVGHTVWYTFTPATNGVYNFSTCSTDAPGTSNSIDIVMSIYTGSCGSFTQVNCNDDGSCTPNSGASIISGQALTAGTTYYIMLGSYRATAGGNIQLKISQTPSITTSVSSLPAFTQTLGTPSAQQLYTVSASGLTSNLVITAPAGYELSTTSGSGFSTSAITLIPTSGTVSTTTIYVRLNASTTNTYSGNITHASTGAITVNVAVTGTAQGACTTPLAPVAPLTLTSSGTNVTGSFSAPTPAPSNYLVIRTTTSTPPSTPVNTVSYANGTSALGGTIIANPTTTTFTDNTAAASTTYYYWVYSYNNASCNGGPLYSTGYISNSVTVGCGTNTITVSGSQNLNWNTASNWSLNHVPLACEDVVVKYSGTSTTPSVVVNVTPVNIRSLTITSTGSGGQTWFFVDQTGQGTGATMNIEKDFTISASGGSMSTTQPLTDSRAVFQTNGTITVGGKTSVGATGNNLAMIGSPTGTPNYYFNGDVVMGTWVRSNSYSAGKYYFVAPGAQTLSFITPSTSFVPIFDNMFVGNGTTPTTLTIAGASTVGGYTNGGLTINSGSSLIIPSGNSLNQFTSGSGTFALASNATLQLGGSTFASGASNGVAGSNMPGGFLTYTFDPASFVIYNAPGAQTVYNTPVYGNLTLGNTGTATAGGAIIAKGDLTINSGSTFDVSGSNYAVTVGDDWTNSGTFTARSGTVTLNGADAQTVTGATAFYNLTVNNTSGGITLASPETVSNTLTLTNGIVTTSATNSLSVTNTSATAAISGGSTTAFINGPLNRTLAANLASSNTNVYTYPVGSGATYLPASFASLATGTPAPVLQVQAVTGDATAAGATGDGTTLGSGSSALSSTEYWASTIVSGSVTNAKVSLTRQTSVSSISVIAKSGSLGGIYSSIGGTPSGNSVTNSNAFAPVSPQYYVIAHLPDITIASALTPGSINSCFGSPSANMTLSVSGSGLISGIIVTPPTGFEISLDPNINFGSSVTVGSGGAVSSTPVYIRLKATDAAGSYSGTISLTSTNAISKSATIGTSNVNSLPVPTLIASSSPNVCIGANETYTTEDQKTNYTWTFSGTAGVDYTIVSGGNSTNNTAVVQWLTPGSKTVTVNYYNATNCTAATPASITVTVNTLPAPTLTASASGQICGNTDITYTTQAGQSTYVWTATGNSGTDYNVTGGSFATNTVTLRWLTPGSKTVTVNYSNGSNCAGAAPASNTITVLNYPAAYNVTGGGSYCSSDGGVSDGTGKTINLGSSQTGVTYELYLNGNPTGIIQNGTTGNGLAFNNVLTGGNYTIFAKNTTTQCTNFMTGSVDIVVNPYPNDYVVTGSGTTCGTGTISISGTDPNTNYVLRRSPSTAIISTLPGNNDGSGLSFTVTQSGTYSVTADNGSCKNGQGSVAVTVLPRPIPTLTTAPGGPYCSGQNNVTYTTQSGSGINAYVWTVSGTQGTDYTITAGGISSTDNTVTITWLTAGTKTVTVNYNSSNGCNGLNPATSTITVNQTPAATVSANSPYACAGSGGSFTITGTPGSTVFYTLGSSSSSKTLDGAGNATVPLGTILSSTTITLTSVSLNGCSSTPTGAGSTATITAASLPVAEDVTGGGNYCQGDAGVPVGLSNSEAGVSYQLLVDGNSTGSPVAGTGGALSFGNQTIVGTYSVQATNTTTNCVRTGGGTTVMIGYYTQATITTDAAPATQTVCQNGTPMDLTVSAVGNNLVYKWYSNTTSSTTGGTAIDNTNSSSYTPVTTTTGTLYYYVTVTGPCRMVTSSVVSVTVNSLPDASISPSHSICAGNGSGITISTISGGTIYYHTSTNTTEQNVVLSANSGTTLTDVPAISTTYYLDSVKSAAGCITLLSATSTVTVNPLPTATISTSATSVCQNGTSPVITFTGANGTAPYTFTYTLNGGSNQIITTSSGNSVTIAQSTTASGTFTYQLVNVKDASSTLCSNSANGTASTTVNPNAVITLTSASSTTGQTVCTGVLISPITYSITGGGTGASVSGLPSGITGTYSNGVFSISGSTTVGTTTTYNYIVTTTGGVCAQATANGTITVQANATVTLTSGNNTQSVCVNNPIANITYSIGGSGTGASASGLPNGVTYSFGSGVLTISGTPTVTGTFNYTVNTTGTCTTPSATGTITVRADATIVLTSGNNIQTLCSGSGTITNITYAIGGSGTGASASGLPNGVTGSYSGGVFTISGTPIVTGTFNYTVNTTGTCVTPSATGTITINQTPTATVSAASPVCEGTGVGITFTGTAGSTITYSLYDGSQTTAGLQVTLPPGSGQTSNGTNTPIIPGTYTYTITDVVLGNCHGTAGASTTGVVNPNPTLVLTSASSTTSQTGCGSITIRPITYNFGGSASGVTVSITPSGAGISANVSGNTVTISGTTTAATTYSYSITTTGGSCGTAGPLAGTITISPYSWIGHTSSNWGTGSNWCSGSTPMPGADVVIPAVAPGDNYPVLPAGTTEVGTLNIAANGTVTINGDNTLQVNGAITGDGTITGSATSNLTTGGTGTVNFTQTGSGNVLQNLAVTGGTLTLGNALNITAGNAAGVVTVSGTGQLATGNNLTLKSDVSGTASVAEHAGTSHITDYITGNVTTERFTNAGVPSGKRAWRLVTSPVVGQTISQAWQEGQVYNASSPSTQTGTYGTIITGEKMTSGTAANNLGYDYVGGGNNASLKHYVIGGGAGGADAWLPLPATAGTSTTNVRDEQAYMLFIRGDRTKNTPTAVGVDNLRATGTLLQGPQTISVPLANALTLVGNPYAAPLNFAQLYAANSSVIQNQFYAWDAHLGNFGAYVTVAYDGTTYKATPSDMTQTGTVSVTQYIQSGQGFFVVPQNGGTLSIAEAMKNTSGSTALSASPFREVPSQVKQLRVNLNIKSSDTSATLADGFMAKFDDAFTGSEETSSSRKAWNFNENLNLVRNGNYHIIEARADVQKTDTLFMQMWNVTKRSYQLQMKADNFTTAPGVQAWLVDNYLGTKQELSLSGSITTVDFAVNSDSLSSKTSRFMIVFRNSSAVLPVTLTSVKAAAQNGGVNVSWTVTNEANIKSYTIEKSTDVGATFTVIGSQAAKNNSGAAVTTYGSFDATPKVGDNYYRIRIEAKDGAVSYSQVVKVTIGDQGGTIQIAVYPNPVRNGRVSLQLTNLAAGTYLVSLYSSGGQTVYQKKITISQPNTTQSEELRIGSSLAQGSYQLRLTDNKGSVLKETSLIVGR